MQWHVRLQEGASPWLPQRIVPKESQVDLVVWCVNTEEGSTFLRREVNVAGRVISIPVPDYALRLRALARLFHQEWSWSIGVIGMQQAKIDMADCPFPPAHDNGAKCFARVLEREYLVLGEKAHAESALGMVQHLLPPHNLVPIGKGIVAGWPWRILNSSSWRIGKDKLPGEWLPFAKKGDVRFLQEAELVHVTSGRKLRFYNTHLSHDAGGRDHSEERKGQTENVRGIVKNRVTVGELPPIVVGDFNCGKNDPENTMTQDFEFAHDDGDKEQIWMGRHSSFPKTIGSYTKLWTTTVYSGGPFVLDGIDLPSLTGSHNSPGLGLNIRI